MCMGREGDVKLLIDNFVEPAPTDSVPGSTGCMRVWVSVCAGKSYKGPSLSRAQFNIRIRQM